ncbi:MAG TPA: hypothetical protein VIK55_06755 [Paludibacter sp.]
MKKLLLILLLSITINSYSQKWDTSPYRSAPKVGECVAVTGISILGLKAVGLLEDRFNFHDATAIIGYALGASGVYIAINQGNHKQRKMNGGFYASVNKIGIKLNF